MYNIRVLYDIDCYYIALMCRIKYYVRMCIIQTLRYNIVSHSIRIHRRNSLRNGIAAQIAFS